MAPTRTPRRGTSRKSAIPMATKTITKTPKFTKTKIALDELTGPLTPGWTRGHTGMFDIGAPIRTQSPIKNRRMTRRSSMYVTKEMIGKMSTAPSTVEFKKPAVRSRRQSVMPPPKMRSPALTRSRRRTSVYVTSNIHASNIQEKPTQNKPHTPSPKKRLSKSPRKPSKTRSPSPKKEVVTQLKERSMSKSPKKALAQKQITPSEKKIAKKVTSARKTSPAKKATSARKTSPAKKATPARKTSPAKKATPAQKSSPARKVSKTRKVSPVRKRKSTPTVTPAVTPAQKVLSTPQSPGLVYSPRRTRQTPQVKLSQSAQSVSRKRPSPPSRRHAKKARSDSTLTTPTATSPAVTPSKFYVGANAATPKPTMPRVSKSDKPSTPMVYKSAKSSTPIVSKSTTSKLNLTPKPAVKIGVKGATPKSKSTPKVTAVKVATPLNKVLSVSVKTPKTVEKMSLKLATKSATPKPTVHSGKVKKVSLKLANVSSPSAVVVHSRRTKTPYKAAKVLGKESPTGSTPVKASKILGKSRTKESTPLTSTPLKSTRKRVATAPPPVSEIRHVKLLRSSNQDESVFPPADVPNEISDAIMKETMRLEMLGKDDEEQMDHVEEDRSWWWAWNCNIL